MKKNSHEKLRYMVELAILVAVTLLLAYTPLGYFRTAGLEISFLMIPVVVGAVCLGPLAGAVLGAVFGITSFIQCLTGSVFGSTLLGINPVFTLITCIVPRILAGWLPGLLFAALRRRWDNVFSCAAACLAGPVLNTLLFMGSLCLFFFQTEYIQSLAAGLNVLAFCMAFVGFQGLLEAIVCFVVGTAVAKALLQVKKRLS